MLGSKEKEVEKRLLNDRRMIDPPKTTAQPLNRSTAQPLNRSTAQPLNRSTVKPLNQKRRRSSQTIDYTDFDYTEL